MENLYDPDKKILCPYDKSHHIRRRQMQYHLVKCKKNHPNVNMVACDFNTNHIIREPELQYHHETCPDRKQIEKKIVEAGSGSSFFNKFSIPTVSVPSDENWDDLNCPTYNPAEYCERNNVIRHLDVAPAAQKRKFRLNERQRLSKLSDMSKSQPLQSGTNIVYLPIRETSVPTIRDEQFNPEKMQEKLGKGANKIYLQYD